MCVCFIYVAKAADVEVQATLATHISCSFAFCHRGLAGNLPYRLNVTGNPLLFDPTVTADRHHTTRARVFFTFTVRFGQARGDARKHQQLSGDVVAGEQRRRSPYHRHREPRWWLEVREQQVRISRRNPAFLHWRRRLIWGFWGCVVYCTPGSPPEQVKSGGSRP